MNGAAPTEEIRDTVIRAFRNARRADEPYTHWYLDGIFPAETLREVRALPIDAPVHDELDGKRDTHNATRTFLSPALQERQPVCARIAAAFQAPAAVAAIRDCTGADLDGSSLRIEYALDRDGFWLEPHTDIGPKRLTLQIYVHEAPGSEDLGTDIYCDDAENTHFGRAPAAENQAFAFVPSKKTWHGFEKRPIAGIRQSLIINYVGPEWRSRHELAFPDQPVRV